MSGRGGGAAGATGAAGAAGSPGGRGGGVAGGGRNRRWWPRGGRRSRWRGGRPAGWAAARRAWAAAARARRAGAAVAVAPRAARVAAVPPAARRARVVAAAVQARRWTPAWRAPTCSARFNFEAGALHGARANTGYQTSFMTVTNSSDAFCGGGALRLDTTFDATNVKGEAIIPLAAAEDVSGKTFSISYKAAPVGPAGGFIVVFLVPSYTIVLSQSAPVPGTWTARSVTLPSGGDAGTSAVSAISIQWLAGATYTGALLVDEIDIR